MKKRILIAGIGNLLFSDEGIGAHVIKELSKTELPEQVELVEIGTATFELSRFMENKDKVIIVDAVISDDVPGTIYKFSPDDLKSSRKKNLFSLHQMGIVDALETAAHMGITPQVVIFGITPRDYKTLKTELTPQLKESLPKIIELILKEIDFI